MRYRLTRDEDLILAATLALIDLGEIRAMPTAETLIARAAITDSQLPSTQQLWVISSQAGVTYSIGFFKEFVKKHLFVDPAMADPGTKAQRIVDRANRYGNKQGPDMIGVPNNLDLDTMRFLKLKKLVFSRTTQGKCSVCQKSESQHAKLCFTCLHTHKKAYQGGGACGAVIDPLQPAGTCACATWDKTTVVLGGGVDASQNCAGFVANTYELDRRAGGKENPFGGAGGQCTGNNSVALMNAIDVTQFKDAVVNAVHARVTAVGGWPAGESRESVELIFGPNTVATINQNDKYSDYSGREKVRGMAVDIKNFGGTYQIYHFRGTIK